MKVKTDMMELTIVTEKSLEVVKDFNDKLTDAMINGNNQWFSEKQPLVETNEQLVETALSNYEEGYKNGIRAGKIAIIGSIILATPLIVISVFEIIKHVRMIKEEKSK